MMGASPSEVSTTVRFFCYSKKITSISEVLKNGLVNRILPWDNLGEHSGQPGRLTTAD